MMKYVNAAVVLSLAISLSHARTAFAETAGDAEARASLNKLYARETSAKLIGEKSKAVLVFPSIVKAGLIVGGQYGTGTLFINGKAAGHYNSLAASYGLQAGVQAFGYALFLMNDKALEYLNSSSGWEIGVGPTVVVLDKGAAKSMTTTTMKDDVYAFIYGQKGLMAGIGIQGSKITKLDQ